MARTKGMLNLSGNLEVNAGAPLDARSVVPTVADLTVAANFQYKYVGMTVVVQATGDMYILTANDVTVAANWKQIGSGGGGSSYTAGEGIVIEDDAISTDNMPAADMSEIVSPLPSVMSRLPRYSTEEQVVAYWIDGKPIYQKTMLIGSTSSSQSILVENLKMLIDYFGYCTDKNTAGIKWFIPRAMASNYYIAVENYTDSAITLKNDLASRAENMILTIQYTKTTD